MPLSAFASQGTSGLVSPVVRPLGWGRVVAALERRPDPTAAFEAGHLTSATTKQAARAAATQSVGLPELHLRLDALLPPVGSYLSGIDPLAVNPPSVSVTGWLPVPIPPGTVTLI